VALRHAEMEQDDEYRNASLSRRRIGARPALRQVSAHRHADGGVDRRDIPGDDRLVLAMLRSRVSTRRPRTCASSSSSEVQMRKYTGQRRGGHWAKSRHMFPLRKNYVRRLMCEAGSSVCARTATSRTSPTSSSTLRRSLRPRTASCATAVVPHLLGDIGTSRHDRARRTRGR
jgi:uncharacterized protein YjiS (DUF1127 family)